jgi:hypothetical protein
MWGGYVDPRFLDLDTCSTITILDIIHRRIFYVSHRVSDTGFCLRLQAEPIQLGRLSPETENISIYWAQISSFHLKPETESSLRSAVF